MKRQAIQNLTASPVSSVLSSFVSPRSALLRRRRGGNHSALRICHDGRRFIRPTATLRGDHDQDARLHIRDRVCDHLAHRVRPDRRYPCSVAAAQQSRSEPRHEPPHIPGPCGCTCQSQAGPAQPLQQAGQFIDRRAAQRLEDQQAQDVVHVTNAPLYEYDKGLIVRPTVSWNSSRHGRSNRRRARGRS